VSDACGILAVAASILLFRWAGRRDDRRLAAWRAREVPLIGTRVPYSVAPAERPAVAAPQVIINVFGTLDAENTEVIRRALGGRDGAASLRNRPGKMPVAAAAITKPRPQ
jgi:hypothetical protein